MTFERLKAKITDGELVNIGFRCSRHIANFCTNFHHQGKLKGFSSSSTPGVFTSSDVEVKRNLFNSASDINFGQLDPKFNRNRWAIVYCEKNRTQDWRIYLQNHSLFTSVYVIEADAGSAKCSFSGAEVFSVLLVIDDVSEIKSDQPKNSRSDAMYKLAMSRAQYELVIFVHTNLEAKFEEFEQSAKTEFVCPETSTVESKIYTIAVQKLRRDDVPKLLKDVDLQIEGSLLANFVADEGNRKVLVNLGKQFGQDIVRFIIDFSMVKASLGLPDTSQVEATSRGNGDPLISSEKCQKLIGKELKMFASTV